MPKKKKAMKKMTAKKSARGKGRKAAGRSASARGKTARKPARKPAMKKMKAMKKPARKAAPKRRSAPKMPEMSSQESMSGGDWSGGMSGEGGGDMGGGDMGGGGKSAEPPKREPADGPAVREGDFAPDFDLPSDHNSSVRLSDHRGRRVVLYFYPRDNTPGCTLEGQDFSRLRQKFEAKNATVLGVSTDTAASHQKFKEKCGISIQLLADPDHRTHEAYGVWREKVLYGIRKMGTIRTTFLIDDGGRITKVWPKVRVNNHADEVLGSL